MAGGARAHASPEDEAKHEMEARRAERDRIKEELERIPMAENVITLHPAGLRRYEQQVGQLQETLEAGTAAGGVEAAAAIRDLIETVTVRPDPQKRGGVQVEIEGRLNALLSATAGLNLFASVGKVVAGAGIE